MFTDFRVRVCLKSLVCILSLSPLSSQYQATQYQARCTQFRRRNGFDGKDFVFIHISAKNLDLKKLVQFIKSFEKDNKNQKEARKDIKDGIKDIKKEQRKNPIKKLNHFRETER